MGLYWGKYPTAYVIEETEDGYYMADGNGFMLTADELLDIAKNITKFAKLHKKDIEECNIENKKRFNREWFDLTEYDIEVIKYTLENCYEECN